MRTSARGRQTGSLRSGELDPVQLDPVQLDPVRLDPVQLDPVRLDPVQLAPSDSEANAASREDSSPSCSFRILFAFIRVVFA
jgi:hypothetical protein